MFTLIILFVCFIIALAFSTALGLGVFLHLRPKAPVGHIRVERAHTTKMVVTIVVVRWLTLILFTGGLYLIYWGIKTMFSAA
jgi:uncharacterized BrkB/YihY/UPF0761 family membrane protein